MLKLALISLLALGVTDDKTEETYTVSKTESTLEWKGSAVGKEHVGTISLKEGNLEIANGKLKGGSFVVDMSSINNTDLEGEWKEKLEGHLKSDDFFGVENYPTAKFVITKVKALKGNSYELTGDFTVKGKTEVITFNSDVVTEGDVVKATGEFTFDRSKFDVKFRSGSFFDDLGDKLIYDEVPMKVSLVANKSSEKSSD